MPSKGSSARYSCSPASPPSTNAATPFVSSDVFRLVVRLEAQKTLDMDVTELERKFHVPAGYFEDQSSLRRKLAHTNNVPGPGSYDVVDLWSTDQSQHPSAVFQSQTERDSFSLKHTSSQATCDKDTTALNSHKHVHHNRYSTQTFSRADRGLISHPHSNECMKQGHLDPINPHSSGDRCSSFQAVGGILPRAARFSGSQSSQTAKPGPGSYDIRRLCDTTAESHVQASLGSPTLATFGALHEKRTVMWSPALTPPSYAVPTAWNSSEYYAERKQKVLQKIAKQNKKHASAHRPQSALLTTQTGTADVQDPFEWLRQQPHGQQRVNFLATKHSLLAHVKVNTHRSQSYQHLQDEEITTKSVDVSETSRTQGCVSLKGQNSYPELSCTNADDAEPEKFDGTRLLQAKDTRISIYCRFPGGQMFTASMYSRKKLRDLKSFITQRQTRFRGDDQFDLYLASGKKLVSLEQTLESCGISNRSLIQIVPLMAEITTPIAVLTKKDRVTLA